MDQAPHFASGITIPDAPAVPRGAWRCPSRGPYPRGAPLITAAPEEGSRWAYNEDEIIFLWTQILKIFVRLGYVDEDHIIYPPADTGRHAGMNTVYMRHELHMSERAISLVERLPHAFEEMGGLQGRRRSPLLVFPEAVSVDYLDRDPRVLAASRKPHPSFSWLAQEEGREPSSAHLWPDDVVLLAPVQGNGRSWVLDTKANTIRTFYDVCSYCDRTIPEGFVDEVPEMEEHYRNWPAFHAPFVLKTYIRDLWALKSLPTGNDSIDETASSVEAFLVARALRKDYGWPDNFRAEAWKRDRNRVERAAEDLKDDVQGGRIGVDDVIIERWKAHLEEIPELIVPESSADR